MTWERTGIVNRVQIVLCLVLAGFLVGLPGAVAQDKSKPLSGEVPDSWSKHLVWRSIGPANMGGRIVDLAINPSDPSMFWSATASGGLLKTVNNGTTFEHQFDKQSSVSIGAVAVSASDPRVVWVGTGENNPRNSVSYGDGVYKSTDGGKTWKHMGLRQSFQVGRIVVHPSDAETVYVGALGRLYGSNAERGVFKTTDGGTTWNKVLFIDEETGIIDLVMHPTDPDTLLAAAWQRRRDGFDSWPGNEVKVAEGYGRYDPKVKWGEGSGLYRTTNGGRKWKRITAGLPTSKLGRIGLDWYQKDPDVVFALVDCENIGKGPAPMAAFLGVVGEADGKLLLVTQVYPDSPAQKAGMMVGDEISAADGEAIGGFDGLLEVLRKKKPGDSLTLKVKPVKGQRDRKSGDIEVKLTPRPGTGGRGGAPLSRVFMGIQGADAEGGARMDRIIAEGPSEKAGLKPGDVITKAAGKPIANYAALIKAIRARKPGDKLPVELIRKGKTVKLTITLGTRPGLSATRPYTFSLGGQRPNSQDQQGENGFEFGGVYKSTDGGRHWKRINSLHSRPMYFSVIKVDPSDQDHVFVLGVGQYHSSDGGVTFSGNFGRGVHADGHALWIDPRDGRHMVIGSDGGTYVTWDRGKSWNHLNQMAIGQFYHVAISPRKPYFVTGGLQDNGTWFGPSLGRHGTGPINSDWYSVGGGDGFMCRVDPDDPDLVYFTSQNGNMRRRNMRTGQIASIRPARQRGRPPYRFNWNSPFILSHANSKIFYAAGNHVFRSLNRGASLKEISPEITRTKQGSATALSESPRNPQVLYAGTDDGALWVTRDGGRGWSEITGNVGLKGPRWVATIEASRFVDGRVYVAFDGHRSDDDDPHAYVSEDFGKTWKSLRSNLTWGSTRCLREDVANPNLLFLGTEVGAWYSIDRGGHWNRFGGGFPTVAVHEIAVHPKNGEIVAATHGRSLWVCDVTTLRQVRASQLANSTLLYTPGTVVRWQRHPSRGRNSNQFRGTNSAISARIDYVLGKKAKKVELKIVDVRGQALHVVKGKTEPGFYRVSWNLRRTVRRRGNAGGSRAVGPGTYRVVLVVDGKTFSDTLTIQRDPSAPSDVAARYWEFESQQQTASQKLKATRLKEELGRTRKEL